MWGITSFRPATWEGPSQRQDTALFHCTFPTVSITEAWTVTWLPPPWQLLSPIYWTSHITGMSLCPANIYAYSYSPHQPESHLQTWSEGCCILFLDPKRNTQTKPVNLFWCFSEALPIQKIYVAFLSRHETKNYSLRIHHHCLLSRGNGLLLK